MIGTYDVKLNASSPNLPLAPMFTHLSAPSSLRILNVPKKIGLWEITNVFATVVYPDNSAQSVEAVKSGGVYVATIPASAAPGKAINGLEITANGIDENGDVVEGYVLGQGDVYVIDRDGSITVGATTYYLHLVDEKPATPHKGDLVKSDDGWEIFDGSAWVPFGGGSGSGATVLTTDGSKIYKGGVEMTSYAALLALVQAGGVTLMGTVGADKDALYYPLFCDTNAIRFDATGTLGGDVKTKSYTVQPVNGDHIRVSEGSLVDLAKKSDIPAVVPQSTSAKTGQAADAKDLYDKLGAFFNTGRSERAIFDNGPILGFGLQSYGSNEYTGFSSRGYLEYRRTDGKVIIVNIEEIALDRFVGTLARSFKESEISNAAKVTSIGFPLALLDGIKKIKAFEIRCSNSTGASWDRRVSWTLAVNVGGSVVELGTTDVQEMVVGQYTRFTFANPIAIPEGATAVVLSCSGATRVALVTTTDPDYSVYGASGGIISGYGVPMDIIGELTIDESLALLAKRSLDPRGGVAANVNLTAPDGTRWALGVNNDGTLFTTIPDAAAQTDDGDEEIEI